MDSCTFSCACTHFISKLSSAYIIAPDKRGIGVIFLFFFHENIHVCCRYLDIRSAPESTHYKPYDFVEKQENYTHFWLKKKSALSRVLY